MEELSLQPGHITHEPGLGLQHTANTNPDSDSMLQAGHEIDSRDESGSEGKESGSMLARMKEYAGTHRKTMIGISAATLMLGYAGMHVARVLRARKRQQEALRAYQDAEAELEAAQARGWLGIGRKKSALEKAEEEF